MSSPSRHHGHGMAWKMEAWAAHNSGGAMLGRLKGTSCGGREAARALTAPTVPLLVYQLGCGGPEEEGGKGKREKKRMIGGIHS